LHQRLQVLADHLKDKTKIPRDTPVHLELASIGDATLMKEITTIVVPYVDSLGINEQELGSYMTSFDVSKKQFFHR
jgi:ADP-dependent phosphofructokinase/glucokinase